MRARVEKVDVLGWTKSQTKSTTEQNWQIINKTLDNKVEYVVI